MHLPPFHFPFSPLPCRKLVLKKVIFVFQIWVGVDISSVAPWNTQCCKDLQSVPALVTYWMTFYWNEGYKTWNITKNKHAASINHSWMVISWGRRGPSGERSEVDVKQNHKLSQRKCKIDTKQHKRWLISPTPWAVLHVKSEQVIQHILPNKIEEVKSLLIPAGKVIPVQSYSPIVSPKHINGISVRHNSVFTAPEYRRDMSMTIHSFTAEEAASVRMLPCTHKLVTGRESSPSVNGLERAKIERQIFHTVGATVVEIDTRGNFSWFTGHGCCLSRFSMSLSLYCWRHLLYYYSVCQLIF